MTLNKLNFHHHQHLKPQIAISVNSGALRLWAQSEIGSDKTTKTDFRVHTKTAFYKQSEA